MRAACWRNSLVAMRTTRSYRFVRFSSSFLPKTPLQVPERANLNSSIFDVPGEEFEERKTFNERLLESSIALEQSKDNPYFTHECGVLPYLYDAENPLECLRKDENLHRDDVRQYLRYLRKVNPSQAIEALKFLKNKLVDLDSDFFSKFIVGLIKDDAGEAVLEAYKIKRSYYENPLNLADFAPFKGRHAVKELEHGRDVIYRRARLVLDPRTQVRAFRYLAKSKKCLGGKAEAVKIFQESSALAKQKYQLEDYQVVIGHHLKNGDLNAALDVLQQMHIFSIQSSAVIASAVMDACYRANRLSSALNIYDMAYPELLTYKAQMPHSDCPAMLKLALQICYEQKLATKAAAIFNRSCIRPDAETYDLLLCTLALNPQYKALIRELSSELRTVLLGDEKPSDATGDIDGLFEVSFKSFSITALRAVASAFEFSEDNLWQPMEPVAFVRDIASTPTDTTLFNIIIKRVIDSGKHEDISELLKEMDTQNVKKDAKTYDLLLRSELKEEENGSSVSIGKALSYWNDANAEGACHEDSVSLLLSLLLDDVLSETDVQSILELKSTNPSSGSGEALTIPSNESATKYLEMIHSQFGGVPLSSYQLVTSHLVNNDQFSDVIAFHKQMVDQGLEITVPVSNSVLLSYIKEESKEEAISFYGAMKEARQYNRYTLDLIVNACEEWGLDVPANAAAERFNESVRQSAELEFTTILPLAERMEKNIGFKDSFVNAEPYDSEDDFYGIGDDEEEEEEGLFDFNDADNEVGDSDLDFLDSDNDNKSNDDGF